LQRPHNESVGVFAKLNFKNQALVHVARAPDSFRPCFAELPAGVTVKEKLDGARGVEFVLAFATLQSEVDEFAHWVAQATEGDAVVWVAYPKMSSKRYRCEFNRDTGWAALGEAGFEPVRMVAIDEDWSAMRFRRVEFIKTMKRAGSPAISAVGRARARK
jgi:hypothetical protein